MEKLKILHIIPDLRRGGAERFVVDLMNILRLNPNIEARLVTLYDFNEFEKDTAQIQIDCIHYTPFSFRKKNENILYKNILDTFQPDIIHTHLFQAELLSSYYLSPSIHYVCHGHDNMFQFRKFTWQTLFNKRLLFDYLEKSYLEKRKYSQYNSHFIANSTHTLVYYKTVLSKRMASNVHLIQCGFNYERFYNPKSNKLLPSNWTLINVGSFQDKKNQQFLIRVANELRNDGFEFTLHLLGSGKNFKIIEQLIIQYKLEDCVNLHGVIEDVEKWYHQADIYVHAAYYEPFGLVFLEAMASGLPVVTLDGKGNRDVILEGKNGYMLADENPKDFANKIVEIVANKDHYFQLSTYAQQFASEFELSKKTDELIAFYASILNASAVQQNLDNS